MKKRRFIILLLCAAVLVVGIFITILRPKRSVLYRVSYLPSLGGQFTLPCSINDNGQIAGFSEVSRGTFHLFLWDRQKGIQDLGPVVNNSHIYINNTGQITATIWGPTYKEHAFIWDPNNGRFVLPTLGGEKAIPYGINNNGQVVGATETASGILHAFVWDNVNGIRDLTASSNKQTRAFSINDVGQVIVSYQGHRRLVDINEGITSTSPIIPVLSYNELNNNGYIVGFVSIGQGKFDIVIWHPDLGIKKFLQLNILDYPRTTKINDFNQVVCVKHRHAKFNLYGRKFLFTPPSGYLVDPNLGRIPLNGYVPIGRNQDFCLTDINNNGCIIGAVQSTKDSRSRGVLLEPIPEKWNKK